MAKQYYSPRNLKFLLYETHNAEEVLQYERYAHMDKETMDMMLDTAGQIGDTHLYPHLKDMDKNEPEAKDGKVTVHPKVGSWLKEMGEGGWISVNAPLDAGGMQAPTILESCFSFIFQAANNGVYPYVGLTMGAANLIQSFGTQELKDEFLPSMYAGKYTGTMCLTEPDAGSSLADMKSSATPQSDGSYKIKGQKIFITSGDHQHADNIIHLLLARIDGAPAGTKGISLFVVPKLRKEGDKMIPNDIIAASIFHKMGQKSAPACHMVMGEKDNCVGYLVGQPNKGLTYMFQMMNEARIMVGVTGVSIASAAYYSSLEYANERPQGRRLNEKDPLKPPTMIINHPDVKRMLLMQKAIVEGSLSLVLECAKYHDLSHTTTGDEKDKYALLLDLLTPIAKTFPCEYGITSVSNALQVFGGYGFTTDFELEQFYRDIRITTIYEGTTGIQSLDLLGRKVTQANGKSLQYLRSMIGMTIKEAKTHDDLKRYADQLENEVQRMGQVTSHLLQFALKGDNERFLADANLYLDLFSIVTVGWQWLKQAVVAKNAIVTNNPQGSELDFYESKVHTMKYWFHYELPKTQGLATRLMDDEVLTITDRTEIFA
ncbi:MAG: acyl-CoA dehydrogenase [Cyclobacteriaceae bacterium]